MSSNDCPLLQPGLTPMLKLLYMSGAWSFACAAVCTPFFAAVPIIAILTGVFPLYFSPNLATAFLPYFISMQAGKPETRRTFIVYQQYAGRSECPTAHRCVLASLMWRRKS